MVLICGLGRGGGMVGLLCAGMFEDLGCWAFVGCGG